MRQFIYWKRAKKAEARFLIITDCDKRISDKLWKKTNIKQYDENQHHTLQGEPANHRPESYIHPQYKCPTAPLLKPQYVTNIAYVF